MAISSKGRALQGGTHAAEELEELSREVRRFRHETYAPRPPVKDVEELNKDVDLNCDLTMKGGTTSGVVYPLAVCELARAYRFRNIGGASAGAIAAAAAAAAEHGQAAAEQGQTRGVAAFTREGTEELGRNQRHRGHVRPGFAGLAQIPQWLVEDDHLFRLFQPARKAQRLYDVVLELNQRKYLVAIWKAVRAVAWPARLVFALIIVATVASAMRFLVAESTGTLITTWRAAAAALLVTAAVALLLWGWLAIVRPLAKHKVRKKDALEALRARPKECVPVSPERPAASKQPRRGLRRWRSQLVTVGVLLLAAVVPELWRAGDAAWLQRTLDILARPAMLAVGVLFVLMTLVGLLVASAWRFITVNAEELSFGLCPGATPPGEDPIDPDVPPLTEWLAQAFDELAGRPEDAPPQPQSRSRNSDDTWQAPLTFGDLWGDEGKSAYRAALEYQEGRPVALAAARRKRLVNLELMTTNLSEGRPYRLPLPDMPTSLKFDEAQQPRDLTYDPRSPELAFYFKVGDMERLFPLRIVEWLKSRSREVIWVHPGEPHTLETGQGLPEPPAWPQKRPQPQRPETVPKDSIPLYRLPPSFDLPVVVAARLSLSFPGLICAVRLYSVQRQARIRDRDGNVLKVDGEDCKFPPRRRAVPHWFSDGGITANFPVHFFDAPLPRWPTFGLNLTDYPEGFEHEDVWLPDQGRGGHAMVWERITSMPGFLGRILSTFHGWRDSLQTTMPGYRGRIAHVRRRSDEGGTNLSMPPEVIAGMALRGCRAGRDLRRRFTQGGEPRRPRETDRHRWLRFRIALSELQQLLAQVTADRDVYDGLAGPSGQTLFQELQAAYSDEDETPLWPFADGVGATRAETCLSGLTEVLGRIGDDGFDFATGAPQPDPDLRQVPPE